MQRRCAPRLGITRRAVLPVADDAHRDDDRARDDERQHGDGAEDGVDGAPRESRLVEDHRP
eukprot:103901-Prymnesium_polylepis.1